MQLKLVNQMPENNTQTKKKKKNSYSNNGDGITNRALWREEEEKKKWRYHCRPPEKRVDQRRAKRKNEIMEMDLFHKMICGLRYLIFHKLNL